MYKTPGIDHILTEFIQAGSKTLCSEINKLINYARYEVFTALKNDDVVLLGSDAVWTRR
jgi:hypothetical protein